MKTNKPEPPKHLIPALLLTGVVLILTGWLHTLEQKHLKNSHTGKYSV